MDSAILIRGAFVEALHDGAACRPPALSEGILFLIVKQFSCLYISFEIYLNIATQTTREPTLKREI